ncbi:MAG: hypothetical protein ABI120_21620 [Gemmatimonadaceae bacterium]
MNSPRVLSRFFANASSRRPSWSTLASGARLAVALVVVPLAGCLKSVNENSNATKYGAIAVTGIPVANGNGAASASAIFFQAFSVNIPDSRLQSNGCQFASVDTTQAASTGQLKAGTALSMIVGSGATTTARELGYDLANLRYQSSAVLYKANDSITVSIPGDAAGFPASSIKLRLAEPLFPEDVTVPTGSDKMTVRWNASSDTTTAIILSLRYANPPSSTYANEQLICALKDDGAEDITGTVLGPFTLSPVGMRSLKLTRWRTNLVLPGDAAVLHIVSTIDTLVKLK